MPTVPMPPSARIHSWSLVKRSLGMRSSGGVRPCGSDPMALRWLYPGVRPAGSDPDVPMLYEGQRHHRRREGLAPHHQVHARSGLAIAGGDIAHGDGAVDARPEAARGHRADPLAQEREDLRALAGRRAAVRPDADAPTARALRQLPLDAPGAGETAVAAAALLDRPGEPRLDRARGLVDVVAVEAEA